MTRSGLLETPGATPLRRVLILADESAAWKVAGLRQLDRLLLTLQDFARTHQPHVAPNICVFWNPQTPKLEGCDDTERVEEFLADDAPYLLLDTHLLLHRGSLPDLLAELPETRASVPDWESLFCESKRALAESANPADVVGWEQLGGRKDISGAESRFLKNSGKSQDGLASRYVNRPLSRLVTRCLLKTPVSPSMWSVAIFVLPLCACFAFLQGTALGFVAGCAIFQLYSILDGCDGEIARAKFLQTESGRRLDSFLDLLGNVLLALTLGLGLARHAEVHSTAAWFYLTEGVAAAILIVLSEGIVFARRTRTEDTATGATRWNGALYQRHHEFLERSGILFFGERFAWWLVQLTKRDMAMLAFLFLAAVRWPECILHLL
ncbi:MAG: CDP-alcohol phosphatidyltransferase family protein, partial [Chthoniobacterales bacterium]|nr:CDP-alcohol phosphatidyltransferase family protein [Chthoniobacterales bacterium]